MQIDFSILSRSLAHPDLALSPLEGSSLGLFLSLKSFAHSGLLVLVLRAFHGGFFSSLHSLLHVDFLSLVGGLLRLEPSVLAFDNALVDFLLPTRSYAYLDLVLLLADMNHIGSTLFVQSLACLGSVLSTCQFNDLGFMLSIQSLARLGFNAFICGLVCVESFPSVFDASCLESSLPSRSSARLASTAARWYIVRTFGAICIVCNSAYATYCYMSFHVFCSWFQWFATV